MNAPTPRTDAQEWAETNRSNAVVLASLARELERELVAEREKVRVLRSACESICEEWGKSHDAPFCAGSNMEKLATAALAATEDAT